MNNHITRKTLYCLFKFKQKSFISHLIKSIALHLSSPLGKGSKGSISVPTSLSRNRRNLLSESHKGHYYIFERLFFFKKDVLLSSGCMEMCPKVSFSILNSDQRMDEV